MFNNNIDLLIASSCGSLAFLGSIIAFLPIIINAIRISVDRRFIIKLASIGSAIAICLGLIHGLIETQKQEIDFYDLQTYWIYADGLFALNILVFFSFSLTDISINIKKITYLTYASLFLIGCHVWGCLAK
ncbi:MAG: hypothetical protein AB4372_37210 [Xenococcus sp. (in: cyanobacteria)]